MLSLLDEPTKLTNAERLRVWKIKKQERKREMDQRAHRKYRAKKKAEKEAERAREFEKMVFSKEDILILAEKEKKREKHRLQMRERRAKEKLEKQMAEAKKEKRLQMKAKRAEEKLKKQMAEAKKEKTKPMVLTKIVKKTVQNKSRMIRKKNNVKLKTKSEWTGKDSQNETCVACLDINSGEIKQESLSDESVNVELSLDFGKAVSSKNSTLIIKQEILGDSSKSDSDENIKD